MRFTGIVAGAILLVVATACGDRPDRCDICDVVIPESTRAVVRLEDGSARHVCDPRCALTYQTQTGEAVAPTLVTDYHTGERLDPARAVFVTGSDVAPDAHVEMLRPTPGDVAERHWHRCVPSVLAFSSRDAAERFQRDHGGSVMALADLGFQGAP